MGARSNKSQENINKTDEKKQKSTLPVVNIRYRLETKKIARKCRKKGSQKRSQRKEKKKRGGHLPSTCGLYWVDHCRVWLGIHPGPFSHGIIRSTGHFRHLSPVWWPRSRGCCCCCSSQLHRRCRVLHAVLVHGICGGVGRRRRHVLALHGWHIRMHGGHAVELVWRLPITHRRCRRLPRRAVFFDRLRG